MPDKEQSPSVTESRGRKPPICTAGQVPDALRRSRQDLEKDEELLNWLQRASADEREREAAARIEALHAEREKLRAIISRAERIIQAERDVLVECHSCPPNKDATDYDPDIREDVEEMDVVLRDARTALNASPKDSPDAP